MVIPTLPLPSNVTKFSWLPTPIVLEQVVLSTPKVLEQVVENAAKLLEAVRIPS